MPQIARSLGGECFPSAPIWVRSGMIPRDISNAGRCVEFALAVSRRPGVLESWRRFAVDSRL